VRLKNIWAKNSTITAEKVAAKATLRRSQFEGALSRLSNFTYALSLIEEVEGHIVEAGVGSGLSLATMYLQKQVLYPERKMFAFDSFRSFPPEYSGKKLQISEGVSLLEHVKDNLRLAGVPPEEITFVEGFYSDTLKSYSEGPIALLHLDVDLGQSYTDALQGFWPHLRSGSVIVFDEYDNPRDLEKWPDAKPAIDEFFKDKNYEVLNAPFLTRRVVVVR
jgi:hypothetical protein